MKTEKEKISVDDYIDEHFPKGEDKRRGEILVVNALAQIKGKSEAIKQVLEIIDNWENKYADEMFEEVGELKIEVQKLGELAK